MTTGTRTTDRDPTRTKAQAILRERRLVVQEVFRTSEGDPLPGYIRAVVKGYERVHTITYDEGDWTCTCGRDPVCPHVYAVDLVTSGPVRRTGTPTEA